MARYNEILVGRYNRLLQKLFSMKGGPPAPQLASEIGVTHNLFGGVEIRYLEGWERFAVAIGVAAGGAGNNSVFRLNNVLGSNVVAVMEKISFFGSVAGNPSVQTQNGGNSSNFGTAVAITSSNLDGRTRPQPSLVGSSQNNAAFSTGTTFWSSNFSANTSVEVIWYENQEFPIFPNQSLTFREGTLNQSVNVALIWRERILEESELR